MLGRRDQPIQNVREILVDHGRGLLELPEAAVEDGLDRRHLGGDPLLGARQPQQRLAELRCGFEVTEAVVGQEPPQAVDER